MKQKKPTDLRENIADMIEHIETMVSDINLVLGEIGVFVKDIDSIIERIENIYTRKHKHKRPEFLVDANGNQCEIIIKTTSPEQSSQLKFCMPSPYMDYTYLELSKDCNLCDDHFHNYTYNEKYPLWMQYDTWKTGNTASDISLVSAETDFRQSDDATCYQWKSGLNKAGNYNNLNVYESNSAESKTMDKPMINFSKCWKSGKCLNDKYCGVYEQMMEQQLDDIEPAYNDELVFDNGSWENHEWSDSFDDNIYECSIALSDEHAIHNTNADSV